MGEQDLFDTVRRSAVFGGPDQRYRYELRRQWDESRHPLITCMLNPSTADEVSDDPTLRALTWFATQWRYGGLLIVNLNAIRSPSPSVMMAADDPIGPENALHLEKAVLYARDFGVPILAAWGNDGAFGGRDTSFCELARMHGVELVCLGVTQFMQPKHPMARGRHRIARDQQAIVWRKAA